ncbi:MAG: hypothetical protein LUE99_00645 [Bacteroides sp.]|nr:hypothetical protein [Bacteroides sp.]
MAGIAACSTDGVETEGGNNAPHIVTLRISIPASDEVEYTRAASEDAETVINRLTIYDFRVATKAGTAKADTLLQGVQYLQKSDGTGSPKPGYFVSNSGGATACLSLNEAVGEKRVFVCVANEGCTHFDHMMQPGITPLDSLRWTPATRILKSDESCDKLIADGIVMTGMSEIVEIADNMSCPIKLERIVARVDVERNIPRDIKIISVSMEGCASRGFLFGHDSDKTLTAKKYNYHSNVSQSQNPAIQTELSALTQEGSCTKVLYLYEYLADSSNVATPVPKIVMKYKLNNSNGTTEVPVLTGNVRFDIRRNRKYTLVVGDGTASTRLVCTLKEENGKE